MRIVALGLLVALAVSFWCSRAAWGLGWALVRAREVLSGVVWPEGAFAPLVVDASAWLDGLCRPLGFLRAAGSMFPALLVLFFYAVALQAYVSFAVGRLRRVVGGGGP